ncbi:MAG TPA: c-type cytochrome [Candidatus Acidoferrum sp.]|nr:c-type cytochrome [Candidatus Acidoferrum sp.]
MKFWKIALVTLIALATVYGFLLIRHGFRATDEPTAPERLVARTVRNISIPGSAKREKNPIEVTGSALSEGREDFNARCAGCHAIDGSGISQMGRNLYPKPPDLRARRTQSLTDGEIKYIIENGVRLTGMPAWSQLPQTEIWKLVGYVRNLAKPTAAELAQAEKNIGAAHYVGSENCKRCHEQIYEHWRKTPMANVVRDPKLHPDAIIPDLATNTVPNAKFTKEDVAFVYGSIWKQRYFKKVGDDYFPEPAQWDITHKKWLPYFVKPGTDWWVPFYPPDNMQRPTGPTCDGCHSVDYNVKTKQVAEWNVGCEKCHGAGSEHAAHPTRSNVLNPSRMDYVAASDTCIQCHSQGRPVQNPIEGRYFDWPVGYRVGSNLRDFWKLEDHKLGEATFTHYADGTAHKNRMQGNDFVQSVMYRRGVTCFDCHDTHGTDNYAQLRKPAEAICLDCHGPMSPNGPRTATLEEHTHHKQGSSGSQCVACHMPKIETTIADVKVSAHTFAFISPAMTDRYNIPNPCTTCHTDKTTAWASQQMQTWKERSPWRTEQ